MQVSELYDGPVSFNKSVRRVYLSFLETNGANTRPDPIPIKMDATKNSAAQQ